MAVIKQPPVRAIRSTGRKRSTRLSLEILALLRYRSFTQAQMAIQLGCTPQAIGRVLKVARDLKLVKFAGFAERACDTVHGPKPAKWTMNTGVE